MSTDSEIIKLQLQKRFKSPVGVRENEETLYANIAHAPLYRNQVEEIEVLQIHDAIENKISYKRFETDKIIVPTEITLYLVDKAITFSFNDEKKTFYKDGFYTIEELYENFGITSYETKIYSVIDGDVLAWFDTKKELFFDNNRKAWVEELPKDQGERVID